MKYNPVSIGTLALACLLGGVYMVYAQNWVDPEFKPPLNNGDQIILENAFENYVHRETAIPQWVSGQTVIGAGGANEVIVGIVGAPEDIVEGAAVTAGFDGPIDPVFMDASYVGVYAYGPNVSHTIVGYSAGTNAESYGVVGRGLGGALAGRFYGPVVVNENSVSSVLGELTVTGTIQTEQSVTCIAAADCAPLPGESAWLAAEQADKGTALYGSGASAAGIVLSINDAASLGGAALQGYASSGYGATGDGAVGAYGIISSANTTAKHYGLAGIATDVTVGARSRFGVFGESLGGFGSGNYGDNNTPKYDLASGVRACVKDAEGALIRARGLAASGGGYTGYFDTEFGADMLIVSVCTNDSFKQCTRDLDCIQGSGSCVGALKIGSVYLTKTNLRGLLCKASGALNLASCTL